MRPLKIALLSRWYAEEHRRTGGTGTVQELAEAVAALGHEVVVLSQDKAVATLEKARPGAFGALEVWLSPREKRLSFVHGLTDRFLKRMIGHRKLASDACDLLEFLGARGPFDVLWAQCEEPDGLVAAFATQMGGKPPPIFTQIYALRYRFEEARLIFTDRKALRMAFGAAKRIAANSELTASRLSIYASGEVSAAQLSEKTCVIHHNLQREFLSAAQAPDPGPESGRVLFLGALNPKKGAVTFVRAARRIASGQLDFAVIGEVTERNTAFDRMWATELGAARAQGLRFELLGKLPALEVIVQIRRASVVVLPSLFDEFSRALVEALALGRPVVTTEKVGAAPLVREARAGVVVPPANAEALAAGIEEVLANYASYAENARACAARLARELSPEAIALQIARHLSEMVS